MGKTEAVTEAIAAMGGKEVVDTGDTFIGGTVFRSDRVDNGIRQEEAISLVPDALDITDEFLAIGNGVGEMGKGLRNVGGIDSFLVLFFHDGVVSGEELDPAVVVIPLGKFAIEFRFREEA